VNPRLREGVSSLQKRSEEHDRIAGEQKAAVGLFTHEVANSLNGLFASLQLIGMKAHELGLADPEMESLLESAQGEIKRLGSLLKDFRAFAQPQSYDFESIDLRKLIDELIADNRFLYESAGVQLKFDFPDAVLPIAVDPEKIKQAILAICKNAVEAMPSGGRLTFRGYQSDSRVILEIEDTGAGIAKGFEVFEPFRTTKLRNSGLGLSIVNQIVKAHKGTVDYVSGLGGGTTLKITLPARELR
jgi:two-component system, sporulation sensor kinase E